MFVETETRPQGEPQKVGTLKLSEAIRIGARIRPQCTGKFFEDGRSCAMGAAMEGAGFRYDDEVHAAADRAWAAFPQLFISSRRFTKLATEIYELNDGGMTREEIADRMEARGY